MTPNVERTPNPGAGRPARDGETANCGCFDAVDDHADLRAWAARYARGVDLDVDHDRLEWAVSTRARRRAGTAVHDPSRGVTTVRLAWGAFEAYDPATFAGVVRHELVHVWEYQRFGESDHGRRFRRVADALDAPLSPPRFAAARVRLVCAAGCGWRARRFRASATVTDPGAYRCGGCGAPYEAVHVASGRRWRTAEGYRQAREALGDGW